MKKIIKQTKRVVVVICAVTFLASPVLMGKNIGPVTYGTNDVWLIGGLR